MTTMTRPPYSKTCARCEHLGGTHGRSVCYGAVGDRFRRNPDGLREAITPCPCTGYEKTQ